MTWLTGDFICLLVSVCMARNVSTSRSLSCGIVVNVLLSLSGRRRGSVPDCGCKITTLSHVLQIILCCRAYFSEIWHLYRYVSTKSINVKIPFILLTDELFTVFLRYNKTEMSRKKRADKESARFFLQFWWMRLLGLLRRLRLLGLLGTIMITPIRIIRSPIAKRSPRSPRSPSSCYPLRG